MRIKIENGVIISDKVISTLLADKIAQANGFFFAEHFVEEYKNKKLILNDDLTIKQNITKGANMKTEEIHKQNFERIKKYKIEVGKFYRNKTSNRTCRVTFIHALYGWVVTEPHLFNQDLDNFNEFELTLTKDQFNLINSVLANDENSTDQQLIDYFVDQGISRHVADHCITQRAEALRSLDYKYHF